MACCSGCCSPRPRRPSKQCLGRCQLPKHRCMTRREMRPGPIPPCMGWLYNAKDAPEHQLRCGWRPGHISCSVLRTIQEHNCSRTACCALDGCGTIPCPPSLGPCYPSCSSCDVRCKPYSCRSLPCRPLRCRPICRPLPCRPPRCRPRCLSPCGPPCPPARCRPICPPARCRPICPPVPCRQTTCTRVCRTPSCRPSPCRLNPCRPSPCRPCRPGPCRPCRPCGPCGSCRSPCGNKPMIRIVRHGGLYTICTKPSELITAPHCDTPLKYLINNIPDADDHTPGADGEKRKMHIEARYNDYHFEYTCSQASFVVDFTPPDR